MDNRIPVNALGLPESNSPLYLQIGDVTVEIYTNPLYKDIIEAIQWGVNLIVDDRPFTSYPMETIFLDLTKVKVFTNIAVDIPTGATENDVYMIYEAVKASGIIEEIALKVKAEKLSFLELGITKTVESILAYRNSARGIVNIMAAEADDNTKAFSEALRMYSDEGNLQEISKLMKVVETLGQPQK